MKALETRLARLESHTQPPGSQVLRFIADDGTPWLRLGVGELTIEMPDDGVSTCPMSAIFKANSEGLEMPSNLSPDTIVFWGIVKKAPDRF